MPSGGYGGFVAAVTRPTHTLLASFQIAAEACDR
jgi:hypothetical protein